MNTYLEPIMFGEHHFADLHTSHGGFYAIFKLPIHGVGMTIYYPNKEDLDTQLKVYWDIFKRDYAKVN